TSAPTSRVRKSICCAAPTSTASSASAARLNFSALATISCAPCCASTGLSDREWESGVGSRESGVGRAAPVTLTPHSPLPTPHSPVPSPQSPSPRQFVASTSAASSFTIGHLLEDRCMSFSRRQSVVSSLPLLSLVASAAAAQSATIDEIVIVGQSQIVENRVVLEGDALRVANTEDFLRAVPGANLNRNGPITALPQYRGASGDRVSVEVNGQPMIAGGPNAMDAPLSVIPGANLETLSVSRGIASVSAAQESL